MSKYLGISFVSDLYCELYLEWGFSHPLQHPNGVSTVFITLWMGKVSHRKAKELVPGHRA